MAVVVRFRELRRPRVSTSWPPRRARARARACVCVCLCVRVCVCVCVGQQGGGGDSMCYTAVSVIQFTLKSKSDMLLGKSAESIGVYLVFIR